jgi:hypothetical protein
MVNGEIVYNLFSTSNSAEHARMKRPVAKYFSLGSVLALEPHMDKAIDDLCDNLERRFTDGPEKGKACDLGEWIAYCSNPPNPPGSQDFPNSPFGGVTRYQLT